MSERAAAEQQAIGHLLEAVLCDGWPRDVTAHALEAFAVAAVNRGLRVDVDAAYFGDEPCAARSGALGRQT